MEHFTNGAQSDATNGAHAPLITPEQVRAACRCANANCDCQRANANVHCPAHDDTNGSLSVDERDGKTLWKCHAGCDQQSVSDAIFARLGRERTNPRSASEARKPPANGTRFDWARAQTFHYHDEAGELLFQVGRIGDGAAKQIRQRRPDGRGGWLYSLEGVRRVLWRLPDVLNAQIVHIHEGEKAAERHNDELKAAGRFGREVATTNPQGAGKWHDDYAAPLDGKHVVVWPDNDAPGRKHAEVVCASCAKVAASVKQMPTDRQPEKGDICERFDSGQSLDDLTALCDATPMWTPSATVNTTTEKEPYFASNDIGNGKRFAFMFAGELRFCGVRAQWQGYAGGRWKPDDEGVAEQRAKKLAQEVVTFAAKQPDDDKRAKQLKHALTLTKRATRETMLKDAASEPGMMVSPEMFDANVELLNCANGTLDLKTWEFRAHRPNDFLTRQTSVAFDPHADCPTWRKCIAQWMPRDGVADYAQDSAGLSLTGRIYEEFFNLLIGPGDNGKTTFLRVLEQLAGNYWHKTEAETIMLSRDGRKPEAPAPALLALKGARLVTVHELDSKHKLNAALIKDLTGRDTISARGLFEKRPTNFLPQFTLWAFGNSKPQIGDDSRGMWRRVRIIDFDQVIPPGQRDPDLSTKLEAELSGILNWALDGLRRVQSRGLTVPEAVSAATNAYRAEQNPLDGFLSDCCTQHPHATANAGELFAAWCVWCRENEEKEGTNKAFATALKAQGFENYRGSDGRRWRGVTTVATVTSDGCSDKVSKGKTSRRETLSEEATEATVATVPEDEESDREAF